MPGGCKPLRVLSMIVKLLLKKHHRSHESMNNVNEKQSHSAPSINPWVWPLDVTCYDRTPVLTLEEQEALASFARKPRDRAVVIAKAYRLGTLARLLNPLRDALATTQ